MFCWRCSTPTPSFRATDGVTFAHLFLGGLGIILYFRDRGWHAAAALVAAIAFAFGGSANSRLQHTGQIISLAYLPLTLFVLARALERKSWRLGALAGVLGALMAIGRDQVALIGLYVVAGYVAWHWVDGERRTARLRASIAPLAAGRRRGPPGRDGADRAVGAARRRLRTGRNSASSSPDAGRCIRRS